VAEDALETVLLWRQKMSPLKKTLDRKKRPAKESLLNGRFNKQAPKKGHSEKPLGRPKVNREGLIQARDEVLQSLGNYWERIGWRLMQARSPEALRKAFRPLNRDKSSNPWLASFLRPSMEKATAVHIRETVQAVYSEVEHNRAIQENYNRFYQKYDEVETASHRTTEVANQSISAEFRRRGDEFEECERRLFASNCKLQDLENRLADQRAYFVRNELLRFKARGYAHNARVFANAIAGLPEIGCRHSSRICSVKESTPWPVQHFEIFNFIQRTWEVHTDSPNLPIVDSFRDAIVGLPLKTRLDKSLVKRFKLKSSTQDNYTRIFLRHNWRFLRLAIERVSKHKIQSEVGPYLIASMLFRNIGQPRTAEDVVLAEIEML
jgi:hypothetical protein